jgi:hypothetical protein
MSTDSLFQKSMNSSDRELFVYKLVKLIKFLNVYILFTYKPALTDLDYGAFFDLPDPTLPPLPPFPPFPDGYLKKIK